MVYASTRIEATIVCVLRDRNQTQGKSTMFEALLDCLFSIDLKVGQKNVSVLKKPCEVAADLKTVHSLTPQTKRTLDYACY